MRVDAAATRESHTANDTDRADPPTRRGAGTAWARPGARSPALSGPDPDPDPDRESGGPSPCRGSASGSAGRSVAPGWDHGKSARSSAAATSGIGSDHRIRSGSPASSRTTERQSRRSQPSPSSIVR